MNARHHHPKSTVSAAFYCKQCGKETQHRIDGGRKGPCMECSAREEAEEAADRGTPPEQMCLSLEVSRIPRGRRRQ